MRTTDTVSGAIMIALAVLMMALTASFPPFPGQKYGPSLFPRILGVCLVVCGVLLILRDRRAGSGKQALITFAPWLGERWRVISFLLVPGLTLVSIFAFDSIGFVPVCAVMLATMFIWFRVPPVRAIAYAALATALLQYFFGKLMRVPLPLGWLLNLPPGWLQYFA